MLNLFKPKFHEPVAQQKAEVRRRYPSSFADLVLAGADCDALPNRGRGEFGQSELNPIPVNGVFGVVRYLFKPQNRSGCRFLFPSLLLAEFPGFRAHDRCV